MTVGHFATDETHLQFREVLYPEISVCTESHLSAQWEGE